MAERIELATLNIPAGVTRKTHFFCINKEFKVMAIPRTADSNRRAAVTRSANAKVRKVKLDKKIQKRAVVEARKQQKENIKKQKQAMKRQIEQLTQQAAALRANVKAPAKSL